MFVNRFFINQLDHFDANLLPIHFSEDIRRVLRIFLDLTECYWGHRLFISLAQHLVAKISIGL